MKHWILVGATLLLMQGVSARESWGPPPACPRPKVDCCPKPCCPTPCKPAPCKPAPCCPKPECKPCPPPCPQPCPPTQICPTACPDPCCPPWPTPVLYAAYNYPARILTRCPCNVFIDMSFIYWQPSEDNLELGAVNNVGGTAGTVSGNVVDMDFDFKPGFKIGVGGYFTYDNWDAHGEYTWLHTTNHESASVSSSASSTQTILPMWGSPATAGAFVYNSASAKWKMNMDILEVDLGRWCYVGTQLLFRPAFGARAAFIRQNYNVTYEANNPFPGNSTFRKSVVSSKSHSWGIGPQTSLNANWLVGYGLRFFGIGEADLLFTQYSSLGSSESNTPLAPSTASLAQFSMNQDDHNTLRAHLDLQLGLGWGMHWSCHGVYTDLQLGYDFQVFFDQNMFRRYNSSTMTANSQAPNGNLYIQGLTVQFLVSF